MGESLRDNLRAEYIKSKGMQLRVTEGDYSYFLETKIIDMEKSAAFFLSQMASVNQGTTTDILVME